MIGGQLNEQYEALMANMLAKVNVPAPGGPISTRHERAVAYLEPFIKAGKEQVKPTARW
ncbi:hypothetical protein ACLK19_27105 [Escherichia coli]